MARHRMPALKEDISPNLVPMIDIMFLLLLFFMLGADMTVRESVDVMLPRASQIKEDPFTEEVPTTNVNIHHDLDVDCALHSAGQICREPEHWRISIRGEDYTFDTLKAVLQADADGNLEPDIDPAAGVRLSARKLVVRADRQAPYGHVQRVIETAGLVKLYKVEVAGAKPAAGPGK